MWAAIAGATASSGQGEMNDCALTLLVLQPDLASLCSHGLPAETQSQSTADSNASVASLDVDELVKDPLLPLLRNAWTLIDHTENQHSILASRHTDRDGRFRWTILDGIVQQIDQNTMRILGCLFRNSKT
jgi:hypothetical protein